MNITAKRSEVQYRALPVDSSSTIKEFLVDPKKYYSKYVLGETVEEEDSRASLIGSIVHCLIFEPDNFDDKFYASVCPTKPTEKLLEYTLALYDQYMAHTTEDGTQDADFTTLASLALLKAPVGNWKLETVLTKWREGNGELYFEELLHTRPRGVSVVSEQDMKIAEDIVNTLRTDEFTYEVINLENSDDIEVFTELQLEGTEYQIWNLPIKGMIDKLIVDHKRNLIYIKDLKVTWEPTSFYKGYYLYRRAYIQGSIYYKLVAIWAKLNGLEEYHIHYPEFIVADSSNFYKPLIYRMGNKDMADADDGFIVGSTYYKGLHEVITDLKWARDKDEWKITRENYVNKGIVTLK